MSGDGFGGGTAVAEIPVKDRLVALGIIDPGERLTRAGQRVGYRKIRVGRHDDDGVGTNGRIAASGRVHRDQPYGIRPAACVYMSEGSAGKSIGCSVAIIPDPLADGADAVILGKIGKSNRYPRTFLRV